MKKTFHQSIGYNLKKERELCLISLKSAAEAAGIDQETLRNYELGNGQISTLEITKLCRLYCIPVHHLFKNIA